MALITSAGDAGEARLREAIARDPGAVRPQVELASLLVSQHRGEEAIALCDAALARLPHVPWALSLKAAILVGERRMDEALAVHEVLVAAVPDASVPWANYGYALKTLGRVDEAIAAYRRAVRLAPDNGPAWWGLANLRTVPLTAADVAVLEQAAAEPGPGEGGDMNRVQLLFALGKALGDEGRFAESFRHYETANALRGRLVPYDADETSALVDAAERRYGSAFFSQTSFSQTGDIREDGAGMIFIVGMPRSGSTLVEQILASHPLIEAGDELFALPDVAARVLGGRPLSQLPDRLADLDADSIAVLREGYLEVARRFRKTDRPFFTDKMPANWQFLGLLFLILPGARVIDVRRPSLPCCLSNFTTCFNAATRVPATLHDLGRQYADYLRMMRHFARVMRGRIHRVDHEQVVHDVEATARRLLDHLGLAFDPAVLDFAAHPRPVFTPSAQQVREPVNAGGLERWRDYEPWLAPLRAGLGAQTAYRT